MKRRRHALGGVLLLAVAAVLAVADWSVLDERVAVALAGAVGAAGLANVVVGVGRPPSVRAREHAVETVTYLVVGALGVAFVLENALAPDGPGSYLRAALWGAAAIVGGGLGIERLRS